MGRILSAYEVAELMGVTERWVWQSLAAGALPGRKIGSRWFVSEAVLEQFLSGANDETRRHRERPKPTLTTLQP